MTRKILSLILIIGFTAAVFGQACSDFGQQQFNNMSDYQSSLSEFQLNPSNPSVAAGASVQLVPHGGQAPYVFVVSSGGGSVNASGVYTAPSAASLNSPTAMVTCTDSSGAQAWSQITISGAGLYATYTPNPPATGQAVVITVQGGTAPYYFQLISGAGTLNQNTYTAPATAETAVIAIMDATGVQLNPPLQIPVGGGGSGGGGGGGGTGLLEIWVAPAGPHVVGGAGCPAGYTQAGLITDTVGNIGAMSGEISFCFLSGSYAAGGRHVVALYVTPADHANGGCASDYTQVGGWPDCSGGLCWGNQFLCAKYSTDIDSALTNFYVTAAPYRSQSCNPGDVNIGSTLDCYYNSCSGVQNFCAK